LSKNCNHSVIVGEKGQTGQIIWTKILEGTEIKAFGNRIRLLRRVRNMTQEQLAEKAGLSIEHVGEAERGTGNPTLTSLKKISSGLGEAWPSRLNWTTSGSRRGG
jgi:DNA-binding phage protein